MHYVFLIRPDDTVECHGSFSHWFAARGKKKRLLAKPENAYCTVEIEERE